MFKLYAVMEITPPIGINTCNGNGGLQNWPDCGGAPLGFGNFWSCGGGLITVYGRKAFSFASGFLREQEGVKESWKRLSEAPLPLWGLTSLNSRIQRSRST